MILTSAAAIWSLADIACIAIYRDMSKISRYNIAIFFKYFIEQLLTPFSCKLRLCCCGGDTRTNAWGGGGGGGGGEKRHVPIGIHIPVYMNKVLPK